MMLVFLRRDNLGNVKFVRVNRQRFFQYTALDDCTRFRVLRLYRYLNHRSSLAFFRELREAMPFPIRKIQCDNGSEFPLEFSLSVQAAGIRHRYITPRRPEQNGKVERSHRIDDEEFWQRHSFASFDDAVVALEGWERPTTMSAFRWRSADRPRARCSLQSSPPRRRIRQRQPGSDLDEVQQLTP